MEREYKLEDQLVDLGQASVKTQGNGRYAPDFIGPNLVPTAIRDDED